MSGADAWSAPDDGPGEGRMKRFLDAVLKIDMTFHAIAGSALVLMMAVTMLDIIMRNVGRPIVGTVEIISFCGAVVIGFAIPYTSWKKAHVYVDFFTMKLSPKNRRVMGIVLFAFIGYNFILYGLDLIKTSEVSPSFRLPYYPIPFGLSLSCFLQCLTLVADLLKNVEQGAVNE
jgi:TRAP-type C4-dicarboxylate transport system permease small subunit